MSDDPIRADGGALCLACGFCCDGMLHIYTIVQPDEQARMADQGLRMAAFGPKVGFYQPCPLHQGGRCMAYDARPLVCRSYECALFKRYMAGAVAWPEAQAIICAARDLRDALRPHLPAGGSFRGLLKSLLATADAGPTGAAADDGLDDELVLTRILALAMHLHENFDGAAPEPAQ